MKEPPSEPSGKFVRLRSKTPQEPQLYLFPADFDFSVLADFKEYALPPFFTESVQEYLLAVRNKSGFAELNVQSKIHKQNPKKLQFVLSVSSSQIGYAEPSDFGMLDSHNDSFS